jgi:hypothetical protein
VLNGVIQELTGPQDLRGVSLLPSSPNPFQVVTYDTIRGSRMMAKPNVPNSEAHIVPQLGIGQVAAGYFYVREKKVFKPTTVYWLRQPGSLAAKRGEEAVLAEMQDLVDRTERFKEFCIWRGMFTGRININEPDVKANVDFQIADSHRIVLGTNDQWTHVTSGAYDAPIRTQVQAWKRLVSRDALARLSDVWLNSYTLDVLMRNQAFQGDMISDRQKDALQNENRIPGLFGLTWHEYDLFFDTGVDVLPYIPDGVVIGYAGDGRPFEMWNGPTADFDAPQGTTGRFTKTWIEKDPSARQALLEDNFFPVLTKPDQVIYVRVF